MLPVIRSQSGRRWESCRLLQHLRSPAALPPRPTPPHPMGTHSPRCHPTAPAPHPHAATRPGATLLMSLAGTPNIPRYPKSCCDEGCSDAPMSCELLAVMPQSYICQPHCCTLRPGHMDTWVSGHMAALCLGTWRPGVFPRLGSLTQCHGRGLGEQLPTAGSCWTDIYF